MTHDPERDAAAYLGGAMRASKARRFETHVLECEDCWNEVRVARTGRAIAESARELAPQSLRETIRASVAAAAGEHQRPHGRLLRGRPLRHAGRGVRLVASTAALALAVTGGVLLLRPDAPRQPAAIMAAVEDFREARIPTAAKPTRPAPDLSSMSLTLDGSGWGTLKGIDVDAYLYHDDAGHQLLLYLSDEIFPIAEGARHGPGAGAPWRASVAGLELLCSQQPHGLLAVADDPTMLEHLAEHIGVSRVPA